MFSLMLYTLLLFWLISASYVTGQINDTLLLCSRHESRTARAILQETVYSLFEFAQVDYPAGCPWDPKVDVFRLQEAMKFKNSHRDWECHACGKRFTSENAIDMHLQNRHNHMTYTAPNASCLSDFCPLLRCSVLLPDLAFGDHIFWDAVLCEAEQFKELHNRCQSIVDRCSVGEGPMFQRLRQWLNNAICDHLTCNRHWEIPDHRLETSVGQQLIFGLAFVIGLLTYYAVIFVRLNSAPDYLRVSCLSSPCYHTAVAKKQSKCERP